ncbi:hypothetical protein CYMTET_10455 [Cymbomonas tetramitiformis]|uniref:Uncharacterized protein n=1 Tax=Cymbomonas tetramitiformis TaxID=36881 RepID=A0AAE0GPK7_9CHLO|nr:hypothetical protein CYMTET_10455 [Cymbomonas tetramitiformis]|eukprot:gene24914-30380_t
MANCGLAESAGKSLGKVLRENSTLKELNIAKNSLGTAGAKGLAEGLKENTTLTVLDICWNSIGAEGVGYLVNSSLGNHKMKLRVIGNNVEQTTLKAFYDQLKASALSDDGDSDTRGPTLEELLAQTECDSIYTLIGKVTNLDPAVAIEAVCERFYCNLISDEICLPFFTCVAMGRMRNLQKDCLTELLGGPKIYKGLDLKTGHAHLRITDEHYDSVIDHLFAAVLHFIPELPTCVGTALTDITEAARLLVVNTQLDEPHVRLLNACDVEDQYVEALNNNKAEAFFTKSLWKTGNFKKRGAGHPALEVSD